MKQLLQSPATGRATVADVPAPRLSAGMVLVRTAASIVSAGTERATVEFARKSLLAKARSRPDLVKKVLDKALTDGALTAWDAARRRLEQPQALGYSSAGVVIAVGEQVEGFRVGEPGRLRRRRLRVPRRDRAGADEPRRARARRRRARARRVRHRWGGRAARAPAGRAPTRGDCSGGRARPHRSPGGADGEGRRLQGRGHRRGPRARGARAGARCRRGAPRGRRRRSRRRARAHGDSGGGRRGRGRGRFVIGSRRARGRVVPRPRSRGGDRRGGHGSPSSALL